MSKKIAKRKWLNPPSSFDTGAVQLRGRYDEFSFDLDLDIWDCNRKVTLNLGLLDIKEVGQRVNKINTLIQFLEDAKLYLEENYQDFEDKQRESRKKKKRRRPDPALS